MLAEAEKTYKIEAAANDKKEHYCKWSFNLTKKNQSIESSKPPSSKKAKAKDAATENAEAAARDCGGAGGACGAG